MASPIIDVENLTIKYESFTAVDSVSFNVREGEIYGFLGPNGAGKSTTIRAVTTLIPFHSGKITINGFNLPDNADEIRSIIGIVQQQICLDKDLTVRENIISNAVMHKVPRKILKKRMSNVVKILELEPHMDKLVSKLSGGWKRKAAIASALMHTPAILFLDEPTTGLDTQSRHLLWDIILQLKKTGTTIILTTHYIEEAEVLCDRVSIINNGILADSGKPSELCEKIGKYAVEFKSDGRMNYSFFSERHDAKEFINSKNELDYCVMRKTTLEDVFLELTGRAYSHELNITEEDE